MEIIDEKRKELLAVAWGEVAATLNKLSPEDSVNLICMMTASFVVDTGKSQEVLELLKSRIDEYYKMFIQHNVEPAVITKPTGR